ncbi:uncharacterized protein ColSpa_11764 [Colletotrichum spaethianum]|uniref:Uncharacterized protein n=1 Tax=Colletotrichum spaethianum TaxID=700344 RepID=A0AA37PG65_9PEZI|nr:uncharacterized protein ColSpa_11764 [Colletotrichum spaethianum]GKT51583.1 hypothetical protein ColSpa_11764 [Colletotrichum spaethianum]
MCTYIYTLHKDCMHKQYQNIFKCASARGSMPNLPSHGLTLDRTLHLPDVPPWEVPDPMCNERAKIATRPVNGRCRACMGRERELKALEREGTNTAAGVRTSILGLEQLVAASKPLDMGK